MMGEKEQTMRSRSSSHLDKDDIDATFDELRRDVRLLVWMMGASLVMTTMILIGILFGDVQI